MIIDYDEHDSNVICAEAARILKRGGTVAYPTESSYALGVLAGNEGAIGKVYELKKRPEDKAMPLIVSDINVLLGVVKRIPPWAEELMEKHWPGPLTLVFEARESVSVQLTAGTGKVAVRIPGAGTAYDLACALKEPLTATSANLSSSPPAETLDEVLGYFGNEIDLIIRVDKTAGGMPSTIIDVSDFPVKVLRNGRIDVDLQEL